MGVAAGKPGQRSRSAKVSRKGSQRGDVILSEAIKLFRKRGYHDVGIDEIGAAAGITGPGIYRHFESKQHLLAAVVWYAAERILDQADEIIAIGTPQKQLEGLVANLIEGVTSGRELTALYIREYRHLGESDRDRLRRLYLRYVADWITVLRKVHPDLSEPEARVIVEAIVWMARSVGFYQPRVDEEALRRQLHAMAMAASLVPVHRKTPKRRFR